MQEKSPNAKNVPPLKGSNQEPQISGENASELSEAELNKVTGGTEKAGEKTAVSVKDPGKATAKATL
jgi:bacteriocin-like protein